jgi:hypothetical protein
MSFMWPGYDHANNLLKYLPTWLPNYIFAYRSTYSQTYTPTYIHAYTPTSFLPVPPTTYVHTYLYTSLPTFLSNNQYLTLIFDAFQKVPLLYYQLLNRMEYVA